MRRDKLFNNPQDQNGYQGENRTKVILSKRFRVYKGSSDVHGTDLMAEVIPSTVHEHEESKKNVKVFGLIQAKYFQKGTTLRIDAQYIEDKEGVIPNFFIMLHTTDDDGIDHWYFFTTEQIKNTLPLKNHTTEGLHYSFSVTKKRSYAEYADIPHAEINDIIYNSIVKTAEFRLQAIVNRVDNKWIKPGKRLNNPNTEFHKSIADLHPLDKLWKACEYYKEFRHMLAWRLVEKMSYRSKITDQTFYNNFILKTTNSEIEAFFNSINITDKIEIVDKKFFKGVQQPLKKSQEIIQKLNDSQIHFFLGKDNQQKSIQIQGNNECDCGKCQYESLNFVGAFETATKISSKSTKSYDLLLSANLFFQLHYYGQDRDILEKIILSTRNSHDYVPYYLALYNLEIAQQYALVDNTVDLYYELLKLPLQEEKKHILKSIGDRSLLNGFKEKIDEFYLTIKDYKDRTSNTSTAPLIKKFTAKITELYCLYRENHCFITDEFQTVFEKYIECCCISYSLQNPYRSHVIGFTELEITLMLLYCRPEKTLQFIQRNSLTEIKCSEETKEYFLKSFDNFFAAKNVTFLNPKIRYTNNRTKNPDLRRKVAMIFNNLCYLATYLDIDFGSDKMDMLIDFIRNTDFSGYDISSLSFIVLRKTENIDNRVLIKLLKTIVSFNDDTLYLPANIISVLESRGYTLEDDSLIEQLSAMALKNPGNNLIPVLWKVLDPKQRQAFQNAIQESLMSNFKSDLFSKVFFNDIINNPLDFMKQYNKAVSTAFTKTRYVVFDYTSTISGLPYHFHEKIDNFALACQKLGTMHFDQELVNNIKSLHPYFAFLIDLDKHQNGDHFELEWLTDDPNSLKIDLFKKNVHVSNTIKEAIKKCNDKRILQKFVYHFI